MICSASARQTDAVCTAVSIFKMRLKMRKINLLPFNSGKTCYGEEFAGR
jgi:hypothetical protein